LNFSNLGYGVFTTQEFTQGSFLLDYPGVLMSASEAEDHPEHMDYIYFFQFNGKSYA